MESRRYMHTLAWISRTTGRKKIYILYLVLLQALLGASSIFSALLFRRLIDRAVAKEQAAFFQAVAQMAVLMISQIAIRALGYFLQEWAHASLENQFKEQLFFCLLKKSYASVTAVHSGEWMNRLTSDTVVVSNGILGILPGLTNMVIRMAGALIVISFLEPMFVTILIPAGIVILLFTFGFRRILKRLHKQIQEADGAVRVFLQEHLGNLMVARTFGMEKKIEETAREKMNQHRTARIRRNLLSDICNTGFGMAANGMYLFGAGYCGYGILTGTLSFGTMTAMLQLIGQVQSPLANLTGFLPRYFAMTASAERLMEAESYPDDCIEEPVAEEELLDFYLKEFESIGLRNAEFAYPVLNRSESLKAEKQRKQGFHSENYENKFLKAEGSSGVSVLSGLDLEIHKGEYVAFTGHSGCGKSTILKLLMSLYSLDSGEQYIKGSNEGGIYEYPLTARWRGLFAYVPQGNQLMSGTIREVVAFGDKEKTGQEELLSQALKIACADEFVCSLENGLNTVLGERGGGLSEGQMQRLAIARAIFSGRPILMLDEATSALDERTEQKLLANLKAMTDKTVLIVTHRPAVLDICNKRVDMGRKNDGGDGYGQEE